MEATGSYSFPGRLLQSRLQLKQEGPLPPGIESDLRQMSSERNKHQRSPTRGRAKRQSKKTQRKPDAAFPETATGQATQSPRPRSAGKIRLRVCSRSNGDIRRRVTAARAVCRGRTRW